MTHFLASVGVRGSVRSPFFTRHLLVISQTVDQYMVYYCVFNVFREDGLSDIKDLLKLRIRSHLNVLQGGQSSLNTRELEVTVNIIHQLSILASDTDGIHEAKIIADELLNLVKQDQSSSDLLCLPLTQYSGGRPSYRITQEFLLYWVEQGFTISNIASILGVSESTVKRRMHEYNIKISDMYAQLTDEELGVEINKIVDSYPNIGYRSIRAHLISKGFRVQEKRVRNLVRLIDPHGVLMRQLYLRATH